MENYNFLLSRVDQRLGKKNNTYTASSRCGKLLVGMVRNTNTGWLMSTSRPSLSATTGACRSFPLQLHACTGRFWFTVEFTFARRSAVGLAEVKVDRVPRGPAHRVGVGVGVARHRSMHPHSPPPPASAGNLAVRKFGRKTPSDGCRSIIPARTTGLPGTYFFFYFFPFLFFLSFSFLLLFFPFMFHLFFPPC